jgi:hypothetical protein
MIPMRVTIIAFSAIIATCFQAAGQTKDECVQRLALAQKSGIISSFRMEDNVPTLVVDEPTWRQSSFDTKKGMAETTVCALRGPGRDLPYPLALKIRSTLTDHVLGEWSGGRLSVD